MSRTTTITILCLTILIGFAFSRVNSPARGDKRVIFNQDTAASRLHITNKLNSGINMVVRPTNDENFEADRDFSLTVDIQSPTTLKNVELAWNLPKNLTLISGLESQTIPELKAGEPQQFTIVVRSPSSENSRIHVRALVRDAGKRFNEIVHYNTVHQKHIDEQKKELAERTLKAIESEAGARLKIYK